MEKLRYTWGVVWGWKWENLLKACIKRIRNPDFLPHLMKSGNCPPSHPSMLVYFLKVPNHKIVHTWTPGAGDGEGKTLLKTGGWSIGLHIEHWAPLFTFQTTTQPLPQLHVWKFTNQREIPLILTFEVSLPKWSPSQNDRIVRSTICITSSISQHFSTLL